MASNERSQHIVIIRRGQFCKDHISIDRLPFLTNITPDYFDVLDSDNRPILTERDIHLNLQAIVQDADKTPIHEVARSAVGVLSTENRKVWNGLRKTLQTDRNNAACLKVVDDALFIVCLDDAEPTGLPELCSNFLCGTYSLSNGSSTSSHFAHKILMLR